MELGNLLSGLRGNPALNQAADQAGLDEGQAHGALQGIVEHVCSGGRVEEVADAVAAKVGVSPEQVQAFLPQILPLLQRHAAGAGEGEGGQGALGGLIGRLGGFLH
jgi:hypothetical protein